MASPPEYEVSVSCRNLTNKDLLSKSDPVLILLESVPHTKRFAELARTELVKDCLNPRFVRKFRLTLRDDDRTFRVAVIDIDDFEDMDRLAEQDYIGRAEFQQSQLIRNPTLTLGLSGDSGEVIFKTVRYNSDLDGHVTLEMANHSFRLKDRATFLEISRSDDGCCDDGDVTLVYRSEQSVNGHFAPIKLSLFTLTLGDRARRLGVELWRYSSKGDHTRLGSCDTSLAELEQLCVSANGAGPLLQFSCKDKGTQCAMLVKYFGLGQ